MTEKERRARIRERRRRIKRQRRIRRAVILGAFFLCLVLVIVLAVFVIRAVVSSIGSGSGNAVTTTEAVETKNSTKVTKAEQKQTTIDEALTLAQGYDYESAINLLETIKGYERDDEIQQMITDFQTASDSMVPVDMDKITHIFYHSLIVDTTRAFGENSTDGFKQWMTTIYEFDQVTQQMYERGYVMISLNDMVTRTTDSDGMVHLTENQLYLPDGKIPYVLSVDDLCYYHSYDDLGTASRLVLDDEGKITCEYYDADGKMTTGDYDVVPRMNSFLEAHPDASYKGARGTIALTGYDGIFGYRTDGAYTSLSNDNLDEDQREYLEAHPNFNYDDECKQATIIAEELKNEGWTLASHTWGHLNIQSVTLERLQTDTEKFKTYVEPLIGSTDIIIFAHGADLAGVEDYNSSNEKYVYLKGEGYNIYCNVDGSTPYFIQYRDEYLRMGRRNIDGYRIWQCAKEGSTLLDDLFDATTVIDPARTDMPEL